MLLHVGALTPPTAFDISSAPWLGGFVNKRDLVRKIARDARLTNTQAAKALDAVLDGVQSSLIRGDRVTLVGFGTFVTAVRKERKVRDPRFGGTMQIAARRVARFAPGADLKLAVRNTSKANHAPNGQPV
jgi:DNA-binding protein HU-beta